MEWRDELEALSNKSQADRERDQDYSLVRGDFLLGRRSPDEAQLAARISIDLYGVEGPAAVQYSIPRGSVYGSLIRPGLLDAQLWIALGDRIKAELDRHVAALRSHPWTPADASFAPGDRVKVLPFESFPAGATGVIQASPGPRITNGGVVYWVNFDEPQVNARDGQPKTGADIREKHLRALGRQNSDLMHGL